MNRTKYHLLFLFIALTLIWSQDADCTVNVEKYLIYPEEALPKRFWPYQKLNIDEVNRRFYALLHETIYEQTKAGIPEIKICAEGCIRIVEKDKLFNLKSLIIDLPEDFETSWIFHDNTKLSAYDIKESMEAAKAIGLLTGSLFGDITVNDAGDVEIELNGSPPMSSISFQLLKVKIIQAKYTEGIKPNYTKQLMKDPKIREYMKSPVGGGPFKYNSKTNKCIVLDKSNEYIMSNKSNTAIEGIKVTLERMKINHETRLLQSEALHPRSVNLVMNMPNSLLTQVNSSPEKFIVESSISQSVDKVIFNFRDHLAKRFFREAIVKSVNRKEIFVERLNNNGCLLSGPYFCQSPNNCTDVFSHPYDNEAYKIITNSGNDYSYSEKGKKKKPILNYKGKQVELVFIHRKDISNEENVAITFIVQDMKKMGIKVTKKSFSQVSWNTILRAGTDWDLAYLTVSQDVASSVEMEFGSSSSQNFSGYKNESLDFLFRKEKSESNLLERHRISCDIHRILHEDYASMFLWTINTYYVYNRKILNENTIETNAYDFFTSPENWHVKK